MVGEGEANPHLSNVKLIDNTQHKSTSDMLFGNRGTDTKTVSADDFHWGTWYWEKDWGLFWLFCHVLLFLCKYYRTT